MSLPPDFAAELRKHFLGEIRLGLSDRVLYSTDASIYQIEPLGVVVPRTQDDLQSAVELAARYRLPVLPRGAGTSLAGQAIGEALILDCSRWLDRIIEIDPDSLSAVVEPGVILGNLNRAAATHGLQFGPDPASAERATMGGVIANNATGAHSISYGMTADHLISAEVLRADGAIESWGAGATSSLDAVAARIRDQYASGIRQGFPATWRNSAGYRLNYLLGWSPSKPPEWGDRPYPPDAGPGINLAPLLAGSEGTLAVIRRATVRLVPKPRFSVLAVLTFPDIGAACDAVPELLSRHPSAIELIPGMLLKLAGGIPAYAARMGWVRGEPRALLVLEFSGEHSEDLLARARALGGNTLIAETQAAQDDIWAIRKAGLGLLDSRPASERPVAFIEDSAVPVERLGEYVRELGKILAEHGAQAAFYAHASAGCLHVRPILDLKRGEGRGALRGIAEAAVELALRLGGSMSSEHGDGLARAEWLRLTYGDEILEAFRTLKRAADPHGLLNPNKVLDAPPMDAHLRYGAGYAPEPWRPSMDFARNGGLALAIEQCNGQGVCRKESGVMCPSFQATRDEKHSTRGRANLLRALIAHPVSARRPELQEAAASALDLCLACKGCKFECPSGVDMAKLKHEFQAEYFRTHRRPARDYLFGYFDQLAQLGAPFGGTANRMFDHPGVRRLARQLFGIAEQRTLPHFRPRRGAGPLSPRRIETCLYLRDSFTHFFEPEIEQAALELLAACGVEVRVIPVIGAGRPLISKGFLGAARTRALALLRAIRRLDPSGELPVVGVEPSEIYSLKDEFLDLIGDRRDEMEGLAARAFMLDEYLVRGGQTDEIRIMRVATKLSRTSPNQDQDNKIAIHGHCYQKIQPPAADLLPVGQLASQALLRAVGYSVEIIPSGCCGMSGAFGYEAEHLEVSKQVGELTLLPAVKELAAHNVRLAAAGVSCRAQIADLAGLRARHPIEWARDAALRLGAPD